MIFNDTNVDGVTEVHRRADEPPFAQLTAPKAKPGRKWGIRYRDGRQPECPFHGPFNSSPPNREAAEDELRRAIQTCSAYQLGLEN